MKKVLIVGSSNMDYTLYIDRFPLPGETFIGKNRFIQPGGKGANQAAAVAKSLVVETHFITALGNDADADTISKTLKELGINLHAKIVDGCTGNATILVDDNSENEIVIIGGANSQLSVSDIDINLIKESEFIILQNEIPLEVNYYVIKMAKESGTKVIYNPAPYKDIDINLCKDIDTFIVNEIELSQYSKCDDVDEGSRKLLNLGIKNVLVTLGKNGSVCYNNKGKRVCEAQRAKAVDTVAAGDTYVGYFTSYLAITGDIQKSMAIASKASAVTVSRKGSIVSIPFSKELDI